MQHDEIVAHAAFRQEIRWQRAPLAAGLENMEDGVEHRPLPVAAPDDRQQRLDDRPRVVGEVARTTIVVARVALADLGRPHARAPESRALVHSNLACGAVLVTADERYYNAPRQFGSIVRLAEFEPDWPNTDPIPGSPKTP